MRPSQKEIIETLHVKSEISPEEETREIVDFIKDYMEGHHYLKSLVLGISGGQDSTLLGKLAQMAVDELNSEQSGKKYSFHALNLPYGEQHDKQDALDAVDFISPTSVQKINIKASVDASVDELNAVGYPISDFIKGNEKARERMKAQYSVAAATEGIVLGADHAAEALTGFYTKHGDGACDIAPLVGLNKRQGQAILKHLGAPEHLYKKIPTADLEGDRPMLSDEEALGVSYDAIDDFLEGRKVSEDDYETIIGWYDKTEHKRTLPYNRYHTYKN